ncbi:Fc.00g049470.m01.CDS01 [Cosmosporella sp. VM-42]
MASQETNSNPPQQGEEERLPETFKDQLDRAATTSRTNSEPQKPNPIVEKIVEYVPPAAKILGVQENKQANESKELEITGPPHRPHHDNKIEEFVRDQHRSKGGDGILAEGKK